MKRVFDRESLYLFSDEEIMNEICRRIRLMRQNSSLSQTDMAKEAGGSLSTIKRIESGDIKNISFIILLKILRAGGMIGGVAQLIDDMPEPPFKNDKRGYFTKRNRE